MAVPKRGDLMIRNLMAQHKKDKVIVPSYDEESEYKHLLWDYEHGQLPKIKEERFEMLKSKYKCTGFFDCGCQRCQNA